MISIGTPTILDIQNTGIVCLPGIVFRINDRRSEDFDTEAENGKSQPNKIAQSKIIAGQKVHRLTLDVPPEGSDSSILFPLGNIRIGLDRQIQPAVLFVSRLHSQ